MRLSEKPNTDYLFETSYWTVFLNPDQYYLGRSLVVVKRNVGDLAKLSDGEWLDFAKLVKKYESALRKAFGATMFNWSCLMNNAFRNNPPDPHVHWHVRPRYSKPTVLEKMAFEDKEFGNHYARRTNREVPEEVFKKIVKIIQDNL